VEQGMKVLQVLAGLLLEEQQLQMEIQELRVGILEVTVEVLQMVVLVEMEVQMA
jgi:hypothetical protein